MSSRSYSVCRAARSGDHRLQLVRVHDPAALGPDDLLVVVVERLEPVQRRRAEGGHHPGARLVVEAGHHHLVRAVGQRDGAADQQLLDPGAGGHRRDLALQRGQLLGIGVDGGPDVDPDVVHVQPLTGGTGRGPDPPDRLPAVGDRPLRVGQTDHLTPLVADHGELAHLGHRHQPLIRRVVGSDAAIEQHVVGGVEPGHVELPQPTQGHPSSHHRVHAADQGVLGQRLVRVVGTGPGPEDEVADRAAGAGAGGHGEAAPLPGQSETRQPIRDQGGGLVGVLGRLGPGQVQIDHAAVPGGSAGDLGGQRRDQAAAGGQLVEPAHGGDQVGRSPIGGVVGAGERAAVDAHLVQVAQLVLAVVPLDQHREHRFVGGDRAAVDPVGEEPDDRLGDGGERVDDGVPLGPGGHPGEGDQLGRPRCPGRSGAPRRPAAGRTTGTGRCGPARRPPGTAAGSR